MFPSLQENKKPTENLTFEKVQVPAGPDTPVLRTVYSLTATYI